MIPFEGNEGARREETNSRSDRSRSETGCVVRRDDDDEDDKSEKIECCGGAERCVERKWRAREERLLCC